MKKITLLVVFVLSAVCSVQAQRAESKTIVSDEFHFIAFFPNRPTQTEGDINTRFGKGYSRRWTLELPDISYEVSVDDFPELSVKMDYKPLNLFYAVICNDLASQYGAKFGYYSDTLFSEYGRNASRRTNELSVTARMFLVRQRFYQVKVVMRNSLEKDEQTLEDIKNFLDEFVFVYQKENEKKYTYGLPQSVSQNLERQ
ncbi:MAG: hypothetical protein M3033_09885 [Acidobacteriota bacterium]|nr:hypothetical protein [Acidobacteriota bacterium]